MFSQASLSSHAQQHGATTRLSSTIPSIRSDMKLYNLNEAVKSAFTRCGLAVEGDLLKMPAHPSSSNNNGSTSYLQNIQVRDSDILSGRGGGVNQNPGNTKFREIINLLKPSYVQSSKSDKKQMAFAVYNAFKQLDIRFVSMLQHGQGSKTGACEEIDRKTAFKKIQQCLREQAPLIRQAIGAQPQANKAKKLKLNKESLPQVTPETASKSAKPSPNKTTKPEPKLTHTAVSQGSSTDQGKLSDTEAVNDDDRSIDSQIFLKTLMDDKEINEWADRINAQEHHSAQEKKESSDQSTSVSADQAQAGTQLSAFEQYEKALLETYDR